MLQCVPASDAGGGIRKPRCAASSGAAWLGRPIWERAAPMGGVLIFAPLNALEEFSRINGTRVLHPQRSQACLKVVTMLNITVRE